MSHGHRVARAALSLAFALLALAGCDEEDGELSCAEDPNVDCCVAFPDRPECVTPTCAENPLQAACFAECEADATLPQCDAACAVIDNLSFCPQGCEVDPLQARCVPPAAGPSAPVQVYRDDLGIPHVFAETDADAFWASGYMQAVDRLGQMDLVRREALGRQAEVFGPRKVERDVLLRTMGIERLSVTAVEEARAERPAEHALLVAWTQGVNARIQEILDGDAPTPASFAELGYAPEPWAIVDGAAAGKLLLFGSSNQLENDLLASIIRQYHPEVWANVPLTRPLYDAFTLPETERPMSGRLAPALPAAPPSALPFGPDAAARLRRFHETVGTIGLAGSNNWAVAGRHTANGRPLVAGDPHQGLDVPSRFYAQHFASATGDFNAAGWAFVGAPGLILGHNAHVAWTATLNYPDMMDLWDVDVSDGVMRFGGEDVPLQTRREVIQVAGAAPVMFEVLSAPGLGVILPEDLAPVPVGRPGTRLLFNWTGFTPTDDIGALVALNTADSVSSFEAAVDGYGIGAFNWVAADASDITYISSMWVPERASVQSDAPPYALLDGRDPNTRWTGAYLDRAMLPRSRGGARGWIGTANNDPYGFTADGDPTNDAFYFGAYFDPGTRHQRLEDELARLVSERPGAITVEDMEALQLDTRSLFADRLLPILEDAWAQLDTDPDLAGYRVETTSGVTRAELAELRDLLAAWDHHVDREQAAPVVFTGLLYYFAQVSAQDDVQLVFGSVLSASAVYLLKVPVLAAEGAYPTADIFDVSPREAALHALELTRLWMRNVLGVTDPSAYAWRDLHCTRFRGREGVSAWDTVPCTPTDGGEGTLNVSEANLLGDAGARDAHRSGGGAIFRMVATFDEAGTPQATVNFPPGNVEDPASVHWDDTLDDWVEGVYRPLLFDRPAIEAAAIETLTLE